MGGIATFHHCGLEPSKYPHSSLKNADVALLEAVSSAIMPTKTTEFPTPETRIEFLLNQVDGGLTAMEIEKYQSGLTAFKILLSEKHNSEFGALNSEDQKILIEYAYNDEGEMGFFMRQNRKWSLRHFMTSERYMTEYFYYEFIPNRHLGCVPVI